VPTDSTEVPIAGTMAAEHAPDRYLVRAVARALDLLDVLHEAPDGMSLAALAEAVGLPKSSVFRYLTTLQSHGYVQQDPGSGDYRPGMRFVSSHGGRLQALSERARPLLEALRDRFGETVNLAVLDGHRIAYLEILESTRAMRLAARVGDRVPVHSSALGKAICADLPDDRVVAILGAEGMPRLTANTITSVKAFLAALEEVRRRGHAVDDREHEEDGRCVAVAVPGSRIPAAISLSAPAFRFPSEDIERVADALKETAAALSGPRRDAA
jgi:IclR family transcriptional regulator, acetate operon repressor